MQRTFKTIVENFIHWEEQTPNNVFLRQPQGDKFIDFNFREAGNQIRRMATALQGMGLPEGSHVGLVSKNCAHWIMADIAISMAGHVSVPFYPTLAADQLNQVLVHSECKVLFVGKLDSWVIMKDGIPAEVKCISFPLYYENSPKEFENWDDLVAKNEPLQDFKAPNPEAVGTIVYTSGTTGVPKGVMITYQAMIDAINDTQDEVLLNIPNAVFFSYLPLCHIAERNIVESASVASGGTVYFAESLESFQKNLQAAQPTHFLAVPRIWTKFQMGILSKMPQKRLDLLLSIPIISGLIKKKIKAGLGLANAQIILTGAAPMPASLLTWYKKLGINIREAYGMTENVGANSIMPANAIKSGTVGKPYNAVKIRIDPETSEIQMKVSWNTIGYYKEPKLTAELIHDGWLCTGDMGEMDSEGYLKITGRVKDMFKSAKGEYIVPAPIENQFATNPFIEQICVAGVNLPQPVALVVLSDVGRTTDREIIIQSLGETVGKVNPNFKNYEHIKKIIVVRDAWSVDNNMLTPTLKIKRNVVENHYKTHMENWYEVVEMVIFE
jgi:long-chain acyl-CoA synthetase